MLGHWESGAGELLERWPREANGIAAEFKRFDHETRSLAGVSVYLSFAEKGVQMDVAFNSNSKIQIQLLRGGFHRSPQQEVKIRRKFGPQKMLIGGEPQKKSSGNVICQLWSLSKKSKN